MRARILYFSGVVVLIALGLSSRAYSNELPAFVASHAGDALWAGMIYFGVRALFVRKTRLWAFGVGIAFCFAIEISQLYQADWINRIRATALGALVLGKGFLTVDLIRYFIGAMVFCGIDVSLKTAGSKIKATTPE
ncbi:DUF2809 domain-containing protein [Cohnella terricola]|uniref:ribosomal maturation YjgA family protein n=1 Tax=Cohnella terricola TaxID=1289167 RepID=UPI001FE25A23|nr:DUF2809 domain-containing protein [Cohnella terricola]